VLPTSIDVNLYREQDFQNFVQLRDYRSAIILALAMNQPGRLLSLFTNVRKEANSSPDVTIEDATSLTGSAAVDAVIATLRDPELVRLLMHVRDWNTTARTSEIAQGVLHAVLKLRTAEDITRAFQARSATADDAELDHAGDQNAEENALDADAVGRKKAAAPVSLKELIDGLLPYTERHLARADKLVQDSYVVDYVLSEMDMGMMALEDGMDIDVAA
jgi:U3 small nucleolar RNA-associated protein 13